MIRLATFAVCASALLFGSEPVVAKDCGQAELLVKRAVQSKSNAEELLRQAVQLCPKNVAALNNLAVKLESAGQLDEAEQLYRRAISADASAPAPHAGLGDVLAARGDKEGAAKEYKGFLTRLAQLRRAGVWSPLFAHEATYKKRLAGLSGDVVPVERDVVPVEVITRSLTRAPAFRTRGLGVSKRILPSIDLHIRFEFNSATLQLKSMKQLEQVSRALKSKMLRQKKISIEGHTDSVGDGTYNLRLSKRRSEAVRTALTENFKIDPMRLVTTGHGETRPVASNGSGAGRATNRRVTFVNLDAGG